MNNNGSRGGFFNGFLVGFILGAAVIFCLFTKKGKKLLKTLTEEGLDKVSDIEELLEEKFEEPAKESPKTHTNGEAKMSSSTFNTVASAPRRFFKGISKRG
ncbi:MAG: hypothetical protein Q7S38_02015 [bacterium]|nr:hypothetical protein [bacterium]